MTGTIRTGAGIVVATVRAGKLGTGPADAELGRPHRRRQARLRRALHARRLGGERARPQRPLAGLHRAPRLESPGARERHRPAHLGDRKPRRLRRLRPDGDRRGLPRRERGGDALRRRARLGRVRRRAGRPVRQGDPVRLLGVRRDGARRHARIHRSARSAAGRSATTAAGRYLERHGRWLHLSPPQLEKAERWFDRWDDRGRLPRPDRADRALVHLDPGRRLPHAAAAVHWLTLAGSTIWCLAFAGAGYALGDNYEKFDKALRYVDYLIVVAVVALVAVWLVRRRRRGARNNGG